MLKVRRPASDAVRIVHILHGTNAKDAAVRRCRFVILPALLPLLLLGGCMYAETPDGRVAVLDLPVESRTTVNKTVHVHAPPGTTVIYQEAPPVVYPPPPRRHRRYRYWD
jgi:D-methionine-binding lipoprotein metQ